MRSKDWGMIEGISYEASADETLEMFRKACQIRSFELNVKKAYDQKMMKMPIYLSVGQEFVAAALAVAFPEPNIFGQHRCHDLYIANGGDLPALVDELLHRDTGCAGGMGGSASIHSPDIGMFGHDGLMGTQVPIGVGHALATGMKTLVVMGDASAEEDYVLAALGFATTRKAPALFVCMDNGLSILTKVEVRRSWKVRDVSESFGMPAFEITDDPWLIMHYAKRLRDSLPAFLNIHVARHLWHAGTGKDGEPEWDRMTMVKEELARLGILRAALLEEDRIQKEMDELWESRLAATECSPRVFVPWNTEPKPEILLPISMGKKLTVAETIKQITRDHLEKNNGVALGQCLTAVGWVGGTVPEIPEHPGLIELSMADVAGGGIAVGYALAGRRPMYIVRYQGFQWFNAPFVANYSAKSKDIWNIPCPIFVRSIAMDAGMGPVASGSHHGMFMRMPHVSVCAPMTPKEYEAAWNYFITHDDPLYVSEHRLSFPINYEMKNKIYDNAHITLFPISSTRLNAIKAAEILEKDGIRCNIIHLFWLKPFYVTVEMAAALQKSNRKGLVIDGDFENGAAVPLAYTLMQVTEAKVHAMGLEDRTAGFAPHLDNLPPTSEKICKKVKTLIG